MIIYRGVRSYLPDHNSESTHIASLCGVCGVRQFRGHPRPSQLRCTTTRKTIGADPTLHRPSRGVGKSGHVAKACDPNSAIFVDQDVCLKHEASVNRVI